MLKVVVFDSGFGGELFADYLEAELPILEVVRVIDWRNASETLSSSKLARLNAEKALQPYLNKVDLIVFANHLLSRTSLKYFRHKYKKQVFAGLSLDNNFNCRTTLILTTKAVAKTLKYLQFSHYGQLKIAVFEDWPALIDDGELTNHKVKQDLKAFLLKNDNFTPEQIILGCSQFVDLKNEISKFFGHNIKILDGFEPALREACQSLKLRGALKKIK